MTPTNDEILNSGIAKVTFKSPILTPKNTRIDFNVGFTVVHESGIVEQPNGFRMSNDKRYAITIPFENVAGIMWYDGVDDTQE